MFFVAFRNLIELSGTEFDFSAGVPVSFRWIPGHGLAWTILLVSEFTGSAFLYRISAARSNSNALRGGGRLAEARFHYQIQSYPTIRLRALYGRSVSRFSKWKRNR
jgi:hypothetical protein